MPSWSAQIFLEQIFARWSVMTLRGKAAIVGMGELPTWRTYPGRTTTSLCTEAARMAIAEAGLRVRSAIRAGAARQHRLCPDEAAPYVRVRDDPGAVRQDGRTSAFQRPDQ